MQSGWYVYIINSTDDRLYTGITTDVERRWSEHCSIKKSGRKGAKFFRGRKPKQLLYVVESESRSTASKKEAEIKKLTRSQKLSKIDSVENQLDQFSEFLCLKK